LDTGSVAQVREKRRFFPPSDFSGNFGDSMGAELQKHRRSARRF
jgi:hypothetical protein